MRSWKKNDNNSDFKGFSNPFLQYLRMERDEPNHIRIRNVFSMSAGVSSSHRGNKKDAIWPLFLCKGNICTQNIGRYQNMKYALSWYFRWRRQRFSLSNDAVSRWATCGSSPCAKFYGFGPWRNDRVPPESKGTFASFNFRKFLSLLVF